MKLFIISGLSGSGKSIALHTLEDLGYYCIDNLPIGLLQAFALLMDKRGEQALDCAVGIDVRNQTADLPQLPSIIRELSETGIECQLIYLDAEDDTLIKRFSETRRKHPLTQGELSLYEAIAKERELLTPIMRIADLNIDTTQTNLHQLRDLIQSHAHPDRRPGLTLLIQSFGFKHGLPNDVDFVFDVRCLPNPHWHPALRAKTGRDPEVADFLAQHLEVAEMFESIAKFLDQWLPHFVADNRSYLSIGIGCTGGQHRSVYMSERLAAHMRSQETPTIIRHRELT